MADMPTKVSAPVSEKLPLNTRVASFFQHTTITQEETAIPAATGY